MKSLINRRNWIVNVLALCLLLLAIYHGDLLLVRSDGGQSRRYPRGATSNSTVSRIVPRQGGGGTKFDYELRILPVGDSITEGWLSSDQNGYRLHLRNLLTGDGNSVDFIGTIDEGQNNPDNQHEGHGGKTISEIEVLVKSDRILLENPNVILLMAGTNDMWHPPDDEPRSQAPDRLAAFIDYILCQNSDAVLLVAAILQINDTAVGPGIEEYNQVYVKTIPGLVADRYAKGYKIRMVNFFDIMTLHDVRDGIHPTDPGYLKVGDVWYSALNNIPINWIVQARDPSSSSGASIGPREECKTDGLVWFKENNGNEIALGAPDGGIYSFEGIGNPAEPWFNSRWVVLDHKAALGVGHNGSEIYFADIDGDGYADYVWLVPTAGQLVAWKNLNGTSAYEPFNNAGVIAEGTGTAYGVRLTDLDGDGRADYVVLRDDGTMQIFLNGGQVGDGEFSWPELHQAKFSPEYVAGINAHNVIFGDINGDGRSDLLIDRGNNKIDAYVQQGNLLDDSFSWLVCEEVIFAPGNNSFLADIDGDGRDDFFYLDWTGKLIGWFNVIGGGPCEVDWIPMGYMGPVPIGAPPPYHYDRLQMADFNGDGKADFLTIDDADGSAWAFVQQGIRSNITTMYGSGAGVRLADLNGDGLDDYIMVRPDTSAIGFWNGGRDSDGNFRWPQMNYGDPIALGVQGELPKTGRHQIHFADMNGDGFADYLVVDESNGAVYGYYNQGQDEIAWFEKGKIAEGPPFYGGSPGEGVRFADLDGDGRDDYLWLDEKGAMLGFLNLPGGTDDNPKWGPLNNFNPIALGVGAERQYVQLHDLNGDGKADYLYVHPEQGAVDVWWNGGPSTTDGSWRWRPGGRIALGVGFTGLEVKFGRLTTSGRYDYLGINRFTGGMVMYQNGCYPGSVIGTTAAGGGNSSDTGTCMSPPEPSGNTDNNAPILIDPPPSDGEPIPTPGQGNKYTPPPTPTTTPASPPPTTPASPPTPTATGTVTGVTFPIPSLTVNSGGYCLQREL